MTHHWHASLLRVPKAFATQRSEKLRNCDCNVSMLCITALYSRQLTPPGLTWIYCHEQLAESAAKELEELITSCQNILQNLDMSSFWMCPWNERQAISPEAFKLAWQQCFENNPAWGGMVPCDSEPSWIMIENSETTKKFYLLFKRYDDLLYTFLPSLINQYSSLTL